VKAHCCKGQQQQSGTDGHGYPKVGLGRCYIICRREPRRIGFDPAQARPKRLERLLHVARDLGGAYSGELLDDQDQTRLAIDHRVPDQRLMINLDVGDVT
jgi:hypothetical protein